MEISGERLLSELNVLKNFTDTPGMGVTRFSYGENDRKARNYLKEAAEHIGLSVRTDAIGNMYINLPEVDNCKEKICIGSHIDTVRHGGWLDGVYGVVSAIEVLRTLIENGSDQAAEVEVVIFAEEEGSNFGSTMTGSKFITGVYDKEDLDRLRIDKGYSLKEMLAECGYLLYQQDEVVWDFSHIKAMLELHIEQGPVLEQEQRSIGIVAAIFGMTTIEVTLTGTGNHAGATPMIYRRDALATAALCISEVERIAKEDANSITVATVGKMSISPNCSNVIPEKVTFTVEVRDKKADRIKSVMKEIESTIRDIAGDRQTSCEIRKIADSNPSRMDGRITKLIERLARETGISYQIIDSGAVHDTCIIAPHAPGGMIFVPSIDGRSHVPFEDTKTEDLVRGAQLLLDTVLNI
jgi:allantoate deiminase